MEVATPPHDAARRARESIYNGTLEHARAVLLFDRRGRLKMAPVRRHIAAIVAAPMQEDQVEVHPPVSPNRLRRPVPAPPPEQQQAGHAAPALDAETFIACMEHIDSKLSRLSRESSRLHDEMCRMASLEAAIEKVVALNVRIDCRAARLEAENERAVAASLGRSALMRGEVVWVCVVALVVGFAFGRSAGLLYARK